MGRLLAMPMLAAAAAAALVLAFLWPERQTAALREVVAEAATDTGYAQSPAILTHLLFDDVEPDYASVDGAWLYTAGDDR